MGDLVNLRQVRKRKQREEKARKADQNRALHGQSGAERSRTAKERTKADKQHDGHKRINDGCSDKPPVADDTASASKPDGNQDAALSSDTNNNVVPIFSPEWPSDD